MAERAKGTLLQMSRMISQNSTMRGASNWDSPTSSDDENDSSKVATRATPDPALQLHTLTSAVSILQRQLEQQGDRSEHRLRVQPRATLVEPQRPAVPSGVDANLFRTIYDLGFEAGSSRREPEQPCAVCEERRRKNRVAAAEQRKRAREETS